MRKSKTYQVLYGRSLGTDRSGPRQGKQCWGSQRYDTHQYKESKLRRKPWYASLCPPIKRVDNTEAVVSDESDDNHDADDSAAILDGGDFKN